MTRGREASGGGKRRRRKRGQRAGAKRGSGARRRGRTRRESSAGGVVYRVMEGVPLFLLIRDSYGNWGFPKGHVERGEQPDHAALREVMEETGLRTATVRAPIETINWFFRFRGNLIHKNCAFFLMETDCPDTKPQRAEGITACKWAPIAEAMELIGYENARGVLRRAHEIVAAATGPSPASVSVG